MSTRGSNHPTSTSSSSLTSGTTTTTLDADSLLASTLLRIRTDDSLVVNSASHHPHNNTNRAPAARSTTAPIAACDAKRVSPIISLAPRLSNNNNNTQEQSAMIPNTGAARGQQQQSMLPHIPNAAIPTTNPLNNSASSSSRMDRGGVSMAPAAAGMFSSHTLTAYRGSSSDHHGLGITLEQINTLQALASNRAASLVAMAAAATHNASSSPLRRHHNAAKFPDAPSPRPLGQFDQLQASSQYLAASSPSTTTLSSQATGQQVLLSSRTPSVRQQLAAEVALQMFEHDNESTLAAAAAAEAAAIIVRKEQVEAALRSAPQRGRKREELSELERMELTRTRNREHARSTRIRKKARYQELLDCEQQLQDVFRKQENVQQKRRRSVLEFLALRCSMLLSVLDDNSQEDDPTQASTSFKSLNGLVQDPDQFCFRCNDFNRPAALTLSNSNCVQHMKNFDHHLASRVVGIFGKTVLPCVCYSIQGTSSCSGGDNSKSNGESSIALDMGHGGFASVEISLAPPSNNEENSKVILMTGIMQFDFSDKNLDKLRSVSWSTMRDFLNDLSSNDDDGLNAQVSHPSVVSLDPAAMMLIQESASCISASSREEVTNKPSSSSSQDRQQLEEGVGGGGPGMNI